MTGTDVLISGGGTGGHVFPALALADELVARGHARDRIRFVGAARGLEATAVPAAGYEIDLLPGRGLERSASAAALRRNLRTTYDTAVAFARGTDEADAIAPMAPCDELVRERERGEDVAAGATPADQDVGAGHRPVVTGLAVTGARPRRRVARGRVRCGSACAPDGRRSRGCRWRAWW